MWHSHKEFACQYRRHNSCRFYPWVRKIPWNRKWQPSPVFLTGKCHGKGVWWATVHGITELDMTEQVTEHTCTQANIHRHIDTHTYRHTHTYTYIYIYFFFFPGKNTEVGWHFLLQGIFPTQGLNLSPALEDGFFITAPPGKPHIYVYTHTHIYLFLSSSRNWLFFFLILQDGGRPQLYVVISVKLSLLRQCLMFQNDCYHLRPPSPALRSHLCPGTSTTTKVWV